MAKVSTNWPGYAQAPGGWGWRLGLGSAACRGETLKLNIWRGKARWPNGSLVAAPGDTREGSGGAVKRRGPAFSGVESTSLTKSFLVVILPVHFVGQAELSDPAHHWLVVSGHKKVSGAFCDVFYNQARPCDSHQTATL